jgi:hypothetical protein
MRLLLDGTGTGEWIHTSDVQHTLMASASDWAAGTVEIEIGGDGANPIGDPIITFEADGYENATVGRRTWIRAKSTGSPVGLKVYMSGG